MSPVTRDAPLTRDGSVAPALDTSPARVSRRWPSHRRGSPPRWLAATSSHAASLAVVVPIVARPSASILGRAGARASVDLSRIAG
jgi:hypothetical protein